MKISLKSAIIFLFFLIRNTTHAQTDSIAAYEKALANAKDDTMKQYYHSKLLWESYLQPKKFVYHMIEGGMYEGNDWSRNQGYGNYLYLLGDSLVGIKRELNAAKEKFKLKKDNYREAGCLICLFLFEEDVMQRIKYLQEAKAIVEQQKASRFKDFYMWNLKINLTFANKSGTDPHLGNADVFNLLKEANQKKDFVAASWLQYFLGDSYFRINKFDSAKYFSEQFLQYQIKIGGRKENYLNVAAQLIEICGYLRQLDSCKYYAKFVEARIDSVSRFKLLTAQLSLYIAMYYQHVEVSGKEFSKEKSKLYFDKAKKLTDNYTAHSIYKTFILEDYYYYYSGWASTFGDYKTAFESFGKYFTMYDSSVSANNVKAFNELQIKYEVAQKDKDILLAQEKTKLHTAWFIVILVTLLAVGLGIFYFQKNRNKINQLEQLLKVRNTIAANLHDEVGSTLGSVAIMSRIAQDKEQDEKNSMLGTISGNAQNMLESMRDIVWSINPENDKLENLLSRMKLFASETLEKQDIDVVFNAEAKQQSMVIPIEKRKDIYLIYKEAIINVAKYAQAKTVTITVAENNKVLTISVVDDGIGFIANKLETLGGNGLKNMQKRAEQIGGKVHITSIEEGGTTVLLSVPL